MNARDFGVTDDPYEAAIEDVEPYRRMSPQERYARFLDLLRAADAALAAMPVDKMRAAWRALDELDDPGRWWERVPAR